MTYVLIGGRRANTGKEQPFEFLALPLSTTGRSTLITQNSTHEVQVTKTVNKSHKGCQPGFALIVGVEEESEVASDTVGQKKWRGRCL